MWAGRIRLAFPLRVWLRWDLWLAFALLASARVTAAVTRTCWAIVRGDARPGIVAVPVSLQSDMGKLLLLWAVTVSPGTIALLMEDELLYVHCLHQPSGGGLPGLRLLERLLARLWG
ncbi:MAG: Na+/H+ antiporter subunit E [Candidatus Bipolaricaulaceae bacterium]